MPAVKYPIRVCKTTRKVSVGKWEADQIYYGLRLKEEEFYLKEIIINENDENFSVSKDNSCGYKSTHEKVASLIGPKFYSRLRTTFVKTWISPVRDSLDKYCTYWNIIKKHPFYEQGQIRRTWKLQKIIFQAERDGMQNVIPILIYFVDTPKALKRELGKSVWKKVCKNTLSFNMHLVRTLISIEGVKSYHREIRLSKGYVEKLKAAISLLCGIKKTLARTFHKYNFNFYVQYDPDSYFDGAMDGGVKAVTTEEGRNLISYVNQYARVTNQEEIKRIITIFRDTKSLCDAEQVKFRTLSPRKMEAFHDKLVVKQREKRRLELIEVADNINKQMKWIAPFKLVIESLPEIDDTTSIEVINDYARLYNETDEMSHCVVDYQSYICKQRYLVMAIKTGGHRSTMGVDVNYSHKHGWSFHFDQHYGPQNSYVECELHTQIARRIMQALAEIGKEIRESENKSKMIEII